MNERIRELMAQAGFDPSAIERMGIMPQAEKFSELIVKECAVIFKKNWTMAGSEPPISAVKTHFGVET